MNMKSSCVRLNDLPDEILMIIFQKLNNRDLLYSMHGVNQRLTKIVHDPTFTSRFTFVQCLSDHFIDLLRCDIVLDRFCLQILPDIHDKIEWLDLESSSMIHVLRAADYSNLQVLGLHNINEESARRLCFDRTVSSDTFIHHITTLFITIVKDDDYEDMLSSVANIFHYIITAFTRLTYVKLYESSYRNRIRLRFDDPLHPTLRSSTLLKLNIRVQCFDDCLHLLDGRFSQLHTLCIDLVNIHQPYAIKNQGDLLNLKCFSLSCNLGTCNYDRLILPLLYRMLNLEQLNLYLLVHVINIFIDGNDLKRNILNRMPRLHGFTFSIGSFMFARNQIDVPSTEDIQRTFIDFPNTKIISYVDYFPEAKQSRCHIYSYPSRAEYSGVITNSFPGGLFNCVRMVSLFDERPFEHEFFLRIVQSFPFMEELSVSNQTPQNHKPSSDFNNNNRKSSVIEYCSLGKLCIAGVHDDYVEQFLMESRTYLQDNVVVHILYESLQRVTQNFTRDAVRMNCGKINELHLRDQAQRSNSLQEFFPRAIIY